MIFCYSKSNNVSCLFGNYTEPVYGKLQSYDQLLGKLTGEIVTDGDLSMLGLTESCMIIESGRIKYQRRFFRNFYEIKE